MGIAAVSTYAPPQVATASPPEALHPERGGADHPSAGAGKGDPKTAAGEDRRSVQQAAFASRSRKQDELPPEERAEVQELKRRDQEVRTHEAAHISAGGAYVRGGASYSYQAGPDGKRYAVGGEVSIDASPVPNNPDATIAKMQTVRRAALAPAQPSGQDLSVAARAAQAEIQARAEAAQLARSEGSESGTGEGDGAVTGEADSADPAAGLTPADAVGTHLDSYA